MGVDSVMASQAKRQEAWNRLAKDLDLAKLESMIEEVSLEQSIEKAQQLMSGAIKGRVLVKI